MSSLIEVKHLKKYYNKGEIKALDDVSVNIERGDVMVVIGPSGSGKSTLLRSLNLLEVPTAGEIDFDGVDITLVAPLDEDDPVPSCRNADGPYHQGQYVLTVDGFLVSANVEVQESQVIETGFAYSDHEPVEMTFVLK